MVSPRFQSRSDRTVGSRTAPLQKRFRSRKKTNLSRIIGKTPQDKKVDIARREPSSAGKGFDLAEDGPLVVGGPWSGKGADSWRGLLSILFVASKGLGSSQRKTGSTQ